MNLSPVKFTPNDHKPQRQYVFLVMERKKSGEIAVYGSVKKLYEWILSTGSACYIEKSPPVVIKSYQILQRSFHKSQNINIVFLHDENPPRYEVVKAKLQ